MDKTLQSPMQKSFDAEVALQEIDAINDKYEELYNGSLATDTALTRKLVSFQANKSRAVYRWYKFKEAFSASLVECLLTRYGIDQGKVLDPFAGSGTALFASSGMGLRADGIELLPIGQQITQTKQIIDSGLSHLELSTLERWSSKLPWKKIKKGKPIPELRITRGAYSSETADSIGKYLAALDDETERVRAILLFALLCVLEVVSFTRKDGQYLRWDHRSGRRQGAKVFDKGHIPAFDAAIVAKLRDIVSDLSNAGLPQELFSRDIKLGEINLSAGSCLDILPTIRASTYDAIVTSPPYCNRYDYTRTYALELALLGVSEEGLVDLRQQMLSCTVENRAKDLLAMNPRWETAVRAADEQKNLQMVLTYLEKQKEVGELNNNGIPRMVRGYFYEMACVIFECARVLKPGAPLIMINDNVRYSGASVPVDIILSEIARKVGFKIEKILVLPQGKGNSSQQMGAHGRDPLRKCVYIWRKA
ncbi:MAG TPA: hypothetical protein VII56_08190 [Rhizomicrobium sp.]